jgi:hypothetical protein
MTPRIFLVDPKNKVGSFSKSLYFFRAAECSRAMEREEDIRAGGQSVVEVNTIRLHLG